MNKVVHFELPVDDIKRAQNFYENVFGWNINEVPGMDYLFISVADDSNIPKVPEAITGTMVMRDVNTKSPIIVIGVKSVREYINKAENMGGKVIMQTRTIGTFGLYAKISDTEGNIIGIWQSLQ